MKLLAIDTSTQVCSICLWEKEVRAEYSSVSTVTHTERLLPALSRLLNGAGWTVEELEGIVVVHGPGSFTGLRIGISAAKGIALGLNIPVIQANALKIAAIQTGYEGLVCPAMDARRGEIFTALYQNLDGNLTEVIPPASVSPSKWASELPDEPVVFCGPGAALYQAELLNHSESKILFKQFHLGRTLAFWGASQFEAGRGIKASELRAAYLRPSDAEMSGPRRRKSLPKIRDK